MAIQVKDAAALNDLIRLLEVGQKFKGLLGDEAQNFMGGYTLKKHSYRGEDYWDGRKPERRLCPGAELRGARGLAGAGCNPQAVQEANSAHQERGPHAGSRPLGPCAGP